MDQKLVATSLSYSRNGKRLIEDISLEFRAGVLHGILGPNGSGKSTLLKTMSGIWTPTLGKVFWNGDPLLSQPRQRISRTISLVPQCPSPSFNFLVEEIVAMGRYSHDNRYWNAVKEHLVYQALSSVDAWHLRGRYVNQLSQGELQRVYIARALITESPILLLDEPTASLDIQHQLEIWQLLQKFVKNGKIVIVTTHDLAIAERFCERIAVLNHGKCIGSGDTSTLLTTTLLQEIFGVVESRNPGFKSYSLYQ